LERNSQEENKEKINISQKFPALWTRASESGHLVQIFDSVSIKKNCSVIILPENLSQNKAEEENEKKPRICKKFPAL
jgi:hypothetical protein